MSDSETRDLYGYATLEPDGEVVAGSYGTWRLTYTAGEKGVVAGGRIRVYTDSDTDRAVPQMDDPTGADYLTVEAPEDVRAGVLVQNVTALVLTVNGRGLRPGEQVGVTYGDTTGGSPGFRSQTYQEGQHFFWVGVDADGSGRFTRLPDPPYLAIVGGEGHRLVVNAPSTVVTGKPFRMQVKAEDAWGNPASRYRGTVEIQASGIQVPEVSLTFGSEDGGVRWIEGCQLSEVGVHRIAVVDAEGGLSAESHPILCAEEAGPYDVYWGDSHGGQIAMAEKIPDFFRYARDVAAIAFAGYQRNDHLVSGEDWRLQQEAERAFHEPGRFVPLPGFEWSPRTALGGHHNIHFRRHNQPIRRNSHSGVADKSDEDTDLPHILDVYRAYRNTDTVITAHVGGEHSNLKWHDPSLEPAVEVTSDHGTFEWILEEALERNYKLGFFGGSDSHNGRPGGDTPGYQHRRYAKCGLAAVYAREVSIDAILEAYKARRCYGTTGARILMSTESGGHLMGEEFSTSEKPEISVFVAGTAPFESVELFRGLERVYSHPLPATPDRNRVRVLWEGASRKSSYSGVIWDGQLKVAGRRIVSVDKIRFDSPRSKVMDVEADGLSWHSVTCGYRSGVVLELDGEGDAEVELVVNTSLITGPTFGGHREEGPRRMSSAPAERLSFGVSIEELEGGPVEMDIGVLNRRVTVSLAPEPRGAEEVEFTFADGSPGPGINPYWVRVMQTDMEMAWSSPIYVDYIAPPL